MNVILGTSGKLSSHLSIFYAYLRLGFADSDNHDSGDLEKVCSSAKMLKELIKFWGH